MLRSRFVPNGVNAAAAVNAVAVRLEEAGALPVVVSDAFAGAWSGVMGSGGGMCGGNLGRGSSVDA